MNEAMVSNPGKPRWFSIKEAAEHLEVGEPTLYRWMREGRITYRKVGDSTRFWQEDLDEVMEVFRSEKSIESVKKICPVCRGGRLAEGALRSTGLNYFQPRKTKFWTFKDSQISTQALMCDRCGSIQIFGDAGKLAALMDREKAGDPLKDSQ
jgi:excisionase family DNA binding protein